MYERKEIEQQILNGYAQTRAKAQLKVDETLQKARLNKNFDDNYKLIKDLEFKIAEAKFNHQDITALTEELNKTKIKQNVIIKKLGLSPSSFKIKHVCELCKDTGFIGHTKCNCFKQKINDELIKASGLEISKLNTFSDYDAQIAKDESHKDSLAKLKQLLLKFTEKFPNTNKSLITISGKTGVGKTFALECTTSEILKKGYTANFLTAFQMNSQFLKYHTCFDANKQSYLNILLEPDLLVIDDLGTEPMLNNVTKEYLCLIISERMMKSKATLISTNLDAGNILDRYGERIFSRLFDKTKSILIRIEGKDLRTITRSN